MILRMLFISAKSLQMYGSSAQITLMDKPGPKVRGEEKYRADVRAESGKKTPKQNKKTRERQKERSQEFNSLPRQQGLFRSTCQGKDVGRRSPQADPAPCPALWPHLYGNLSVVRWLFPGGSQTGGISVLTWRIRSSFGFSDICLWYVYKSEESGVLWSSEVKIYMFKLLKLSVISGFSAAVELMDDYYYYKLNQNIRF